MGEGSLVYAAEYDQNLPLWYGAYAYDYSSPYDCYYAADKTYAYGFSMLNVLGYVKDTGVFFCPAQPNSGWQVIKDTSRQWTYGDGQTYRPGVVPAHIGYMYQLHSTYNPAQGGTQTVLGNGTASAQIYPVIGSPGTNVAGAAYPKTTNFPPNLVLGTDILYDPSTVPHNDGTGINSVYVDGHASTSVDRYFKTMAGLNGSWTRLDRDLAKIENQSR